MSKMFAFACCFLLALSARAEGPVLVALLQEQPAEVPALKSSQVDELKKLDGKIAKVTGKVTEVYKAPSGNVVVINFGKDSKNRFMVAIKKDSFGNWEGGAAAIEKMYADKELTVTGKIMLYKELPEIVVTMPKEIVLVVQ